MIFDTLPHFLALMPDTRSYWPEIIATVELSDAPGKYNYDLCETNRQDTLISPEDKGNNTG